MAALEAAKPCRQLQGHECQAVLIHVPWWTVFLIAAFALSMSAKAETFPAFGLETEDLALIYAPDFPGLSNVHFHTEPAALPDGMNGRGFNLAISGLPKEVSDGEVHMISFDFGEPVKGFTVKDIVVRNGKLSGPNGGPQIYRAAVAANGRGNLSVSVAQGAATGKSGQISTAAYALARLHSERLASKNINEFMHSRALNVIRHQPDLIDLLRQRPNRIRRFESAFSLGSKKSHFHIVTENSAPFWTQLSGSRIKSKVKPSSTYIHGTVGTFKAVNARLLAGAMLQVDQSKSTSEDDIAIQGDGWFAGPYFVSKLKLHPVYFRGSILFGRTANDTSFPNARRDALGTSRWLFSFGMEGSYKLDRLVIRPNISVSHLCDGQRAKLAGSSSAAPDHFVKLTAVDLGVSFAGPVFRDNDRWRYEVGLTGTWSKRESSDVKWARPATRERGKLRIDGAIRRNIGDRMTVNFRGSTERSAGRGMTYKIAGDWKITY